MRRFSGLSGTSGTLAASVANFVLKIRHLQSQSRGSLLECIEGLLTKHEDKLAKHYKIEGTDGDLRQNLWQCLNSGVTVPSAPQKYDVYQLPFTSVPTYNKFIGLLYPKQRGLPLSTKPPQVMDIINNAIKYHNVNHTELFKYYCELPKPHPLYLPPPILQHFIDKFLFSKSDFVKPNVISELYFALERNPHLVLNNVHDMLDKRNDYVTMVGKILDDVRSCGIELSSEQQLYLAYISFYKDKPEIVDKINSINKQYHLSEKSETPSKITYPKFDFNLYSQLKSSLPYSIDTFNVLLFHGIRHSQREVIDDILKVVGFSPSGDKEITSQLQPNSKTIRLLLDYFSSPAYLSNSPSLAPFVQCIDYLNKSNMVLDIKVVNLIIKALIATKFVALAESIHSEIPVNADHSSESIMSKQLTAEDKYTYDKLIKVFENLETITSDSTTFSISPTESTFVPFMKYYCQIGDIDKTKNLLNLIQHYNIPRSSRILKPVYMSIIKYPWTVSDLVGITGELINIHDHSYTLTHDNAINQLKGELTPALQSFVNDHLKVPEKLSMPIDRRNFVKLSDDLLEIIYQAFLAVVEREYGQGTALAREINDHKYQLQTKLDDIRGNPIKIRHSRANKKSIYVNDEMNYLKKSFLIDLIYLVEGHL